MLSKKRKHGLLISELTIETWVIQPYGEPVLQPVVANGREGSVGFRSVDSGLTKNLIQRIILIHVEYATQGFFQYIRPGENILRRSVDASRISGTRSSNATWLAPSSSRNFTGAMRHRKHVPPRRALAGSDQNWRTW